MMMSIKKAKAELQKLKDIVKPERQKFFMRIHGETEAETLARYGIDDWPEGATFWEIWPEELNV
jgi:hypothetical protein